MEKVALKKDKEFIDLEQIIELDRLNMTPLLKAAGIEFDPDRRREGLQGEINKGAWFVVVERNHKIIAYVQYLLEGNGIATFPSIQVHPEFKGSFIVRSLLSDLYQRLKNDCPNLIHSSVHNNNKPSLSLHRRLGFREKERINERILFEINGREFLENISKFGDRTRKSKRQQKI